MHKCSALVKFIDVRNTYIFVFVTMLVVLVMKAICARYVLSLTTLPGVISLNFIIVDCRVYCLMTCGYDSGHIQRF